MIFINGFLKAVENIPQMKLVLDDIENKHLPLTITGLSEIHKAHITSYLAKRYGDKPILLVTPDEISAKKLCEDIEVMLGQGSALLYPSRDINFRKSEAVSREFEHLRLSVLGRVLSQEVKIVVASAVGATQLVTPPHLLKTATFTIESREQYNLDELRARLIKSGYSHRPQIDGISQFSVRGGILDIYSPHEKAPVRIEFWGDDIDSMSYFDIDTQRRTETVSTYNIIPACEVLCKPEHLRKIIEEHIAKTKNKEAKFNLQNDIKSIDTGLDLTDIDKYLPIIYSDRPTLFNYFDESLVLVSNIAGIKDSIKSHLAIEGEDIKLLFAEGLLTCDMIGFSLDFIELAEVL
ncbi:MAG: hypothetical protein IJC83_01340, partial [Oscillospiraceae bacterium]|nr:hypothetical protein [Oscillospiraceae bacterium]